MTFFVFRVEKEVKSKFGGKNQLEVTIWKVSDEANKSNS